MSKTGSCVYPMTSTYHHEAPEGESYPIVSPCIYMHLRACEGTAVYVQGKQLEIAGASGLLSVSVQPADPSSTQAAQRAKHMLSTSKVDHPCLSQALTATQEVGGVIDADQSPPDAN